MLYKVKLNGSQYCCAISYLHSIVISVACCTRFEVFQCPEGKNIRKLDEKKKKKSIKLEYILSQSIAPPDPPAEPSSLLLR